MDQQDRRLLSCCRTRPCAKAVPRSNSHALGHWSHTRRPLGHRSAPGVVQTRGSAKWLPRRGASPDLIEQFPLRNKLAGTRSEGDQNVKCKAAHDVGVEKPSDESGLGRPASRPATIKHFITTLDSHSLCVRRTFHCGQQQHRQHGPDWSRALRDLPERRQSLLCRRARQITRIGI